MVAYPAFDTTVHIQVLGQHPGGNKDLVTLEAAHYTLVSPTVGDQANNEVGACHHFQSFDGWVAAQAAAAKASFPFAEEKD